jgi:hypothetical protein
MTRSGELVADRWSAGIRKQGIAIRDRVFLLRQHKDRGLVAAGRTVSEIYEDEHWDGSGTTTTYVNVEWDTWLGESEQLEIDVLKLELAGINWDRLQGSGVMVPTDLESSLEELWANYLASHKRTQEQLPN